MEKTRMELQGGSPGSSTGKIQFFLWDGALAIGRSCALLCRGNIEKRECRHFKANSGCFSNLSCAFVCTWIFEKPKLAFRELLAIWGPDFALISLCTKQECVRRNWQRTQDRFELV